MPSPASPAGTAEVGTAMPTVVADLGGLDHMAWVVTGYTLATACSTPVWGKLGDLFPRKTVFLTSIGLFLAASVLCGAAPSMNWLIAFRVLQRLGAGGLAAGAFALISVLLPPRERGRYQGPVAVVMAIGQLGGPLVGGFVTARLGWRWAFYNNVPVGLVCVAWCWVTLRVPAPGPGAGPSSTGGASPSSPAPSPPSPWPRPGRAASTPGGRGRSSAWPSSRSPCSPPSSRASAAPPSH
ncbi:MFS transporter [Streptomyces koyangensis]